MRKFSSFIAILLFCAGVFCLAQSNAQVSMTGAGLGAPSSGGGGGSVQQVDTNACTFSGATNSYSVSQTISASANGLIVVAFANDSTPNETLTASWNGTSMTSLAHVSNTGAGGTAYIFGLRAPTTGTQTLNIGMTPNPTDRLYACSVSFKNVNQTSDALAFPAGGRTNGGASQNGAGPFSINITSASGHMVASGAFDITPTNSDSMNLTQYSSTSSNINVYANYGPGAGT